MKPLTFTLLLIVIAFTIGCSSENPICSDNFCVTGEIFEKSDLPEDAEYDSVNVDEARLLALLAEDTDSLNPAWRVIPAHETGPLADIVADVAAGRETYLDQTVTITATVQLILSASDTVSIFTGNPNVLFFIDNPNAPPFIMHTYVEGSTYTFTVNIIAIGEPDTFDDEYVILAEIVE